MTADYKRLIISDLHLGSVFSREEQLLELLKTVDFDELILAGDIIDFIKVPIFKESTSALFDFICKTEANLVYVTGNHDVAFKKFAGHYIGNVSFVDSYEFTYAGRKYRVEHGDKYETGIIHSRLLINVVSLVADLFERWLNIDLSKWWDVHFKKKMRLKNIWSIVKWNSDVDVFVMGHTHKPEVLIWVDKDEDLKTYVNCGDWVEHATYVIVGDNQLRLRNFLKKA